MNRFVSTMPDSVMEEIASQITMGNTCYMERNTGKVITIDKTLEDSKSLEAQKKQIEAIENKIEKYVKIEKIGVKDQILIMRDFLDQVTDKSERKELSNSLKRKSPIRNFTREVESNMGLNQHWVNFYTRESKRWVTNFLIDAYNY